MIKDYKKKFDLQNKLAFVAGGLGYIGKEIVKALISMDCKVVVLDNFSKKNNKNENIYHEYMDLSKTSKLKKSFYKIIKKYGTADIFINASYPKTKDWKKNSFKEISLKSFETNVKIHLNSYIWCSKIIAEHMLKDKINGSIINLSSIYGLVGQDLSIYKDTNMRENITYSIIKGGVINYTRQMASYYGPKNIRVNCLCPGGVLDKINVKNKNFIKNYKKKVPLGRLAKSREIAACCLFLSSEASTYVTGTTMVVDGGWTSI